MSLKCRIARCLGDSFELVWSFGGKHNPYNPSRYGHRYHIEANRRDDTSTGKETSSYQTPIFEVDVSVRATPSSPNKQRSIS